MGLFMDLGRFYYTQKKLDEEALSVFKELSKTRRFEDRGGEGCLMAGIILTTKGPMVDMREGFTLLR
jgi:hypothetical protein